MSPRKTGQQVSAEELAVATRDAAPLPTGVPGTDADLEEASEEFLSPDAPPYADVDDEDPDLADMNDPNVTSLGEPPLIGGGRQTSDIFGSPADRIGRVTSPKLYAQAAHFPTATQFRVWKMENGIPVAIGAIDAEATEDDFIRMFYTAMPSEGDGRFQYCFRPVDIRGKELGKEFSLNISEHHGELVRIRKQKAREARERSVDPMVINPGGDGGAGAAYAEEMGRMFESAVEASERRTELLQNALEAERERVRLEEKERLEERTRLADRATDTVQKMTDRLLEADRARADEQIRSQQSNHQLLISTITSSFEHQQSAARDQTERLRAADENRMQQDREFFERQRLEIEARRKQEADESERRRIKDQDEWSRRMQSDREEGERRVAAERARMELEQKRLEEQRIADVERLRLEAERQDKLVDTRMERERLEADRRREEARDERERWYKEQELRRQEEDRKRQQERDEWERKERERREDLERKERLERDAWDRKIQQEREDAARREQERRDAADKQASLDRERMERERQDFTMRMERERQEWERRERERKDEAERIEARRRDELALQQKQLELSAQKDREHAERMLEIARLERDGQRDAQERREKLEREAREQAERDRTRQHEMALREMEMAKERDREHQERMLQLAKIQQTGGSLLGSLGETLGMEAPEILARIFGGGGGEEGGGSGVNWAEAIPKVLVSLAELGKAAMTAKSQTREHGRHQLPPGSRVIQTPQGPQILLPGAGGIPLATAAGMPFGVATPGMGTPLPVHASIPPQFRAQPAEEDEEPSEESEEVLPEMSPGPTETPSIPPAEPQTVDTLERATAAGIALPEQKKARKALRALIEKLGAAPEDEWVALATTAIAEEMSIYYYIKAISVEAALREAVSDDSDLAARLMTALVQSGAVPDDVPITEDDYQKRGGARA